MTPGQDFEYSPFGPGPVDNSDANQKAEDAIKVMQDKLAIMTAMPVPQGVTDGHWRPVPYEANGVHLWEVHHSDHGELVCTEIYSEADARLIAAARELYNALEFAAGVLESSGHAVHTDTQNEDINLAIHNARVILAKAGAEPTEGAVR